MRTAVALTSSTFLRYTALGVFSLGVNIGLTSACATLLGASSAAAGAVGYITVMLLNFALARRYVFRSRAAAGVEFGRFMLIQAITRLLEYVAFLALVYAASLHHALAIVLIGGLSYAGKFVLYRIFVFQRAPHARRVPAP